MTGRALLMLVVLAGTISSCARGPVSLAIAPPGLARKDDFPRCLIAHDVIAKMPLDTDKDFPAVDAAIVDALRRRALPLSHYDEKLGFIPGRSALFGYFDCLLGQADDRNANAQLLRGHIMLTLMAQYGAEIVRASRSNRQPAQSLRLITHIREAELMLAGGGDALVPPPPASQTQLGNFWLAARIASVLQVAIDLETVYVQRSLDSVSNLTAALGGGPAAAAQADALLGQAAAGIAITLRSELYGTAFLTDARASMDTIKATNEASEPAAVAAQWGLWTARLNAACADLAASAKLSDPSCSPTMSAVKALRLKMEGVAPIRSEPPAAGQ